MNEKFGRILFFFLLAGILLQTLSVLTAAPNSGDVPDIIQGAFYDASYKCIYMKGASIKPDTWQHYEMPIAKANIGYDGKSGQYKGFSMLRIKASTKKAGTELAVYIDNVVLKDPSGRKVVHYTFDDGETHGPYFSWGKKGSGAGKVETVGGQKCFALHGTTTTQYGSTGLEVQWVMPKSPDGQKTYDFTKPGYTLSFDYYVATK